MIWGESQAT